MPNINTKEIFVHVGLPKTASTFLQKRVFPKLKDCYYIKKCNYFSIKDEDISQNPQKKVLLSHESLIKDNTKGLLKDDRRIRALQQKFPEAKTIIFFRRHDKWIKSKYYYYIRKNGFETFDRYFDIARDTGIVKKEMLDYTRDIRLLESSFPAKPLVIFQEELNQHPLKVVSLLADFIGTPFDESNINVKSVNRAFSNQQLRTIRAFNRRFKYKANRHPVKFIRQTHKNLRKLAVHSVGLISLCIPDFTHTGDEPLIPQRKLVPILEYFNKKIKGLRRISVYGNAKSILRKSPEELKELKDLKLGIVYLGVETGNEELLKKINKGATYDQMVEAGRRVIDADLKLSTTVLLGLGGVDGSRAHAMDTARILTDIDPHYAGALTLMLIPGTPMGDDYQAGNFQLPDKFGFLEELGTIIGQSDLSRCFFASNHASNYLPIKGTLPKDKERLLGIVQEVLDKRDPGMLKPEEFRAL